MSNRRLPHIKKKQADISAAANPAGEVSFIDRGKRYLITCTQNKNGFTVEVKGEDKQSHWRMIFDTKEREAFFLRPGVEPLTVAFEMLGTEEVGCMLHMEAHSIACDIYARATNDPAKLMALGLKPEQEQLLADIYNVARSTMGKV